MHCVPGNTSCELLLSADICLASNDCPHLVWYHTLLGSMPSLPVAEKLSETILSCAVTSVPSTSKLCLFVLSTCADNRVDSAKLLRVLLR